MPGRSRTHAATDPQFPADDRNPGGPAGRQGARRSDSRPPVDHSRQGLRNGGGSPPDPVAAGDADSAADRRAYGNREASRHSDRDASAADPHPDPSGADSNRAGPVNPDGDSAHSDRHAYSRP